MGQAIAKIVVIGRSSVLLEGVADLLQLAGYEVALSGTWEQAEEAFRGSQPDLAILDLSDWLDSLDLPQQIQHMSPSPDVPVLLLNFSGDERIWLLRCVGGESNTRRVEIYAHTLLGPDALLDKVRLCLAQPALTD
jgi:CheY-like chemotaxis protein